MKKKIAFLGNPAALKFKANDNTGNIVHGYAARLLFDNDEKVKVDSSQENIEFIRDKFHTLGFITATTLNVNATPGFVKSHEKVADFIEKLNMPVCVFGFGSQADIGQNVSDANVDPRSVRLLRVLADHSEKVAVRGEFTADLCKKYGVKNVEVIGCQSAYVAGLRNWDNKHELLSPATLNKVVSNFTSAQPEEEVFRLAYNSSSDIIGQGKIDTVDESISLGEIDLDKFINRQSDYPVHSYVTKMFKSGFITREDYYKYIKNHFFKFYNIPDWLGKLESGYDFSFGTRFHGNMIALWAGIPALWISHDMRTQEFCEYLKLPSFPHSKLSTITNLDELTKYCDYSSYWAQFPLILSRFVDYLKCNNVWDMVSNDIKVKIDKVLV